MLGPLGDHVFVQIYLDLQVMAAICSLGFLCGLALAPRARKPSRWWKNSEMLFFSEMAFILSLVIRPVELVSNVTLDSKEF